MHKQLIEKTIKFNNEKCPEMVFENPLIDRGVANALSKSLVNILKISKQNPNVNNKLSHSILKNIRNICHSVPEGHVSADEKLAIIMKNTYYKQIVDQSDPTENLNEKLDNFLKKKFKELDIHSGHKIQLNSDLTQALLNISLNELCNDISIGDYMHRNEHEDQPYRLIQSLCKSYTFNVSSLFLDEVSLNMKNHIESQLLEMCYDLFVKKYEDLEKVYLSNVQFIDLIKKCSVSSQFFQMSYSILNFVFIMTDFHQIIHDFILLFVNNVKKFCPLLTFTVLYPPHLNCIAVLLDFDINELKGELREFYAKSPLQYLCELNNESDLILLLSHFPQWFDIYFEHLETYRLQIN